MDLWGWAKEQRKHNPLFTYSLGILYAILQATTEDVIRKKKLTICLRINDWKNKEGQKDFGVKKDSWNYMSYMNNSANWLSHHSPRA